MFIGNLLSEEAKLDFCYSYRKRGTNELYAPDMLMEDNDCEYYRRDGKLICDYVGYNAASNLGDSVDIIVDLKKECFVDSVTVRQFDGEANHHKLPEYENRWLKRVNRVYEGDCDNIAKVEVFLVENGVYKIVGILEPQTGKAITDGSITVEVGEYTDKIVLRVTGNYKHMYLGKLEITGATDMEKCVYPNAEKADIGEDYFTNLNGICAEQNGMFAAENFAEKYQDLFGETIPVTGNGAIVFDVTGSGEETYEIHVTKQGVKVSAGTAAMLLYASERLLQLCTAKGIRTAHIEDKPFLKIRGFHVAIPSKREVPFLKRLIKYVIMPMGYNTVFLQISAAMEYKRHPEINEAWKKACDDYEQGLASAPPHYPFVSGDIWTQEEVEELCTFFRMYGLEIIPEVQSLGHTQYISMAHPEMGEPEKDDSIPYYYCLCPNHPEYYNMMFDIIEEVVATVKPKQYVHIGHDEIYTLGNCERCRDIPQAEIYAKEVIALHDKIQELGLKTMMWADMIQEDETYKTASAIDVLPKDIVCLSFTWYIHLHEMINKEERLSEHGYQFMLGNMYSSHFPRYDQRKQNKALLGGEVSTWTSCNEERYAFEGKMYEFLYTSNMLWNKGYQEKMRLTYCEIVNKEIERIREYIRFGELKSYRKKEVPFEKSFKEVPFDIRNDFEAVVRAGAGESKEITVGLYADRITVLHALSLPRKIFPFADPEKLGEYVIAYTDGTKEIEEILYGVNIYEYQRRYAKPLDSMHYRHQGYPATYYCRPVTGKTAQGKAYTLYEHCWGNPHPEKEIASITLHSKEIADNHILLFDVSVFQK